MNDMSTIIIHENQIKSEYIFSPGQNLFEFLREKGFAVDAPCGGHGLCGKCKVRLCADGRDDIVQACKITINTDCTVYLSNNDSDLSWNASASSGIFEKGRTGYGAAVDLGTTTVALKLYDLSDGSCLGSISEWNTQKTFGADVITRIGFCIDNQSGLEILSEAIRNQIKSMLSKLCGKHGVSVENVSEIVLAGNTVMQHIFVGISPNSIAAAPFTPATLFDDGKTYTLDGIPVYPAPCVAGYVGGDITAGILCTGINERKGKALFIDVGTNGEMVLGDADGMISCAVASGPAFEGAGISCGMPASFGAINKVCLTDSGLEYEVLGGTEAEGICGSGLLDLAACLLELGYIDESGILEEDENGEAIFRLNEKVYITQKDIRQLQLAKAAVAAGIKRLMQTEELSFDDINALYLAGGFGNRLRPESAVKIGMLPKDMLGKIYSAGNTSLSGAEEALLSPSSREKLSKIKANCRYIELSSDENFSELFIDEMYFPEE